jgi:FecR protein
MHMFLRFLRTRLFSMLAIALLVVLTLPSPAAAANPIGKVESLVSPAFLDRGGLTVPIQPGVALYARDRLRTGSGARLLLSLNEGSLVRLGENATFDVVQAEQKRGLFNAAFDVLEGAFRFTTRAIAKTQPRNVNIRVARNATIGIRGTDLWGRGREDQDIVCLIEGKIDVTGNDNKTQRLDQPLQLFQSTRTAPPSPLSMIDPQQLSELAKETDIAEGRGASANGKWQAKIANLADTRAADDAIRTLRNAGYPAKRAGQRGVAITGLISEAHAQELAARVQSEFGFVVVAAAVAK